MSEENKPVTLDTISPELGEENDESSTTIETGKILIIGSYGRAPWLPGYLTSLGLLGDEKTLCEVDALEIPLKFLPAVGQDGAGMWGIIATVMIEQSIVTILDAAFEEQLNPSTLPLTDQKEDDKRGH